MPNFAAEMKRTFHSRFTMSAKLTIILLGIASFLLMWRMSIAALPVMMMLVISIERVIHTEYVFTEKGTLIISRGRFARTVTIDLAKVNGIRQVRNVWGRWLVIECADGSRTAVQPRNEGEFIRMIYKAKDNEEAI